MRRTIICRLSRNLKPGTLLDVGCGGDGLARWIRRYVVGVDFEFETLTVANFSAVKASGLRLPFPDHQFPIVVCSDVIEHLALPNRIRIIRELLRVTSDVLIVSFPSGTSAKDQDTNIKTSLLVRGSEIPSWLDEHLRHQYPTPEGVLEIVQQIDPEVSTNVYSNFNLSLRKYYYRLVTAGSKPHWRALRLFSSNIIRMLPSLCSLGECYRSVVVVRRNNTSERE